jgi:hypothetical protein
MTIILTQGPVRPECPQARDSIAACIRYLRSSAGHIPDLGRTGTDGNCSKVPPDANNKGMPTQDTAAYEGAPSQNVAANVGTPTQDTAGPKVPKSVPWLRLVPTVALAILAVIVASLASGLH